MREFILNELAKIENDNNVEILFAAEAGSRAWGFESPDSDYDVRFIYRRPAGYYLSVSEGYKTLRSEKDTIEVKNGDFDVVGWDIKKTLYLFGKSNPALLEWLTSPTIYSYKNYFYDTMINVFGMFFIPRNCIYHYISIAQNDYEEFLQNDVVKLKKYFYAIRPIMACEYIEKYKKFPPVDFAELMGSLDVDPSIFMSVQNLLAAKKNLTERNGVCDRNKVLNDYIKASIPYYKDYARNLGDKDIDWQVLDELSYVMITVTESFNNGGTEEPPTDNTKEPVL